MDQGFYDPEDEVERKILAYVYIPIVQREIDLFVELWNNLRTRLQRGTLMPDGNPNIIYNSPEEYGIEDKGWPLTTEELAEAAEVSGVLDVADNYLTADFRRECSNHLPDVDSIQAKEILRDQVINPLLRRMLSPPPNLFIIYTCKTKCRGGLWSCRCNTINKIGGGGGGGEFSSAEPQNKSPALLLFIILYRHFISQDVCK